jgi:hypothetical protein
MIESIMKYIIIVYLFVVINVNNIFYTFNQTKGNSIVSGFQNSWRGLKGVFVQP